MSEPEVLQFIYPFDPVRPELVTDQGAWTEEDVRFGQAHFAYLKKATLGGIVLLAGRSLDRVGESSRLNLKPQPGISWRTISLWQVG